jgi:anti-sigma regulatory factor (Ser/Thr protein kinase)
MKYLTFGLLDSLATLSTAELESSLRDATIRRIGPLVEFAYLDYPNAITLLAETNNSEATKRFRTALVKPDISHFQLTTSLSPKNFEFIRGFQTAAEADDLRWMTFCKRLENAGEKAGLSHQFAKALTGTVEEMASNVMEHSEYPETSIVGYRWTQREFEYVVADSGIGVLESLRKNAYYSYLDDAGKALETAVQEGESRHGRDVGRGLGFRDLLNNIANRNSFLRFRSGNSSLVIDGTQSPPIWNTQPSQSLDGFLISIVSKQVQNK